MSERPYKNAKERNNRFGKLFKINGRKNRGGWLFNLITIEGVKRLNGCSYDVLPDRIETATFLVAAAITKGNLTLTHTRPDTIKIIIDKLRKGRAEIDIKNDIINVRADTKLDAVNITTNPYPDFPTDMQAQFIALNAISKGKSKVVESVFENRFMHVRVS